MTKSNGIASLKQAAKLLNRHAPDGESLAYINPEEGRVLRARGGSGIMTLAGVPTYGLWDTIVDYGKKALKYAPKVMDFLSIGTPAAASEYKIDSQGEYVPQDWLEQYDPENSTWMPGAGSPQYYPPRNGSGGSGNFLTDLAKGAWTGIKERYSDPKNIAGDLGKAWLTVESYKGQKDLNKFEQDKYDRALADIAAGEAQFAGNIGASPLEITNMPSETDIASFTDVTLPSMTTTAVAEGGRIGFQEGTHGIFSQDDLILLKQFKYDPAEVATWKDKGKGLLHVLRNPNYAQGGRIGYNLGGIDTPFQGIGALNPRMGYQDAGEVVEKTFSEGVEQQFPSDALGAINVNEEQIAIISDMNNKGMDTSLISSISGVDEDTVIRYIRTLNAQAQGGRIGAEKGGIMPLLDMGGMEKDYRQDGGFVPIGRKEKADDVPARLSKNEFVFTADAVKAAGGGDIDQGAQRMYNVMKNLEAGGQISQQSQGKR